MVTIRLKGDRNIFNSKTIYFNQVNLIPPVLFPECMEITPPSYPENAFTQVRADE